MSKSKSVNGLIVNSIVKMDWESKMWLETDRGVFYVAAKEYEGEKGKVTVFFTSTSAFVFTDEGDFNLDTLWAFADMKKLVKEEYPEGLDASYPSEWNNYVPIISGLEGVQCDATALENFGLKAFASDIEARVKDVSEFGAQRSVSEM